MNNLESIIQFFIDIFIRQSFFSDGGGWQREYKLMAPGVSPDSIYELRISKGADVKTRRMSIRQIGATEQSKSVCYMVTYDDFLVIKIPPVPLPDFESYLEHIEVEKNIAELLNPAITCLSPGLAAILSNVPEIQKKLNQTKEASEEAYIRLLKKEPQFQQYLKVGGQFVFFMELSQHAFFDRIIADIHCEKERISEEITKNSHVFDDLVAFESVYGSDREGLFFGVNDLYKSFQIKLDEFLSLQASSPVVEAYEKREWLFAKLAGIQPDIDRNSSVAGSAKEIRQLLTQVMDEKEKTVQNYLSHVRSCVRKKIFDNHRANMETLIIKTLEVLCRLKNPGVAIRDLKPDNMLLAGSRAHGQYPLSDPDQYDLGLIDLETAVAYKGAEDGGASQPLLAGTPSYMTPSHLFGNSVLNDVFENKLSTVFCLQDWFAAIGIIFCIVTGQRLFEKTARLLPEIVRLKNRGLKRNDPESEMLKNVSRIFWKTAADEFRERLRTNSYRLENIALTLPEHIGNMLRSEAKDAEHFICDAIKQCADSQKLFPHQAKRLIHASAEAVRAQRIKWESNGSENNVPSETRDQAISLFQRLETLKSRLNHLNENGRQIHTTVSCDKLLTFLFNIVANGMRCS